MTCIKLDTISNPDEIDINMLVIPGVDVLLHSPVTTYAKNMAQDRGDTFYIMDLANKGKSITDATTSAGLQDTNYAAVYYPWVRILDTSTGKLVWVPPSVVMAGVIAFTDKVSHEWFAPAGLNRGTINTAKRAERKLTQSNRDEMKVAGVGAGDFAAAAAKVGGSVAKTGEKKGWWGQPTVRYKGR